jgi:pimeloyl-ACP methyl ester carboxylesterase
MEKQIIVNKQLISYEEQTRQGNDAVLVFLHGWRSQKEVWQPIIKRLQQPLLASGHPPSSTMSSEPNGQTWGGEYGMYALDLPGFGKSPFTPPSPSPSRGGNNNGWAVGDYAKVVKEFIEKLDLKNVILIGHSFGGRVAIKLVAKYPILISKLILVDSAGFAMDANKKSAMNFAAKIARPFFKPKFMQGLRKKIYRQIGAEDYLATPELQKTFVNITSEDLTADMKNIKLPTLIIWGENDTETPLEFGKKMNTLIPNSKFVILKNVGHFSFLDKPEEFVKILENFI